MPIIDTIKGDLLDLFDADVFNIIAHGCNCQGNMGAGIAKQIATRYPIAALQDIVYEHSALMAMYDANPQGAKVRKLEFMGGSTSTVYLPKVANSGSDTSSPGHMRYIVNAYTQYYPGAPQSSEDRIALINKAFWSMNGEFRGCTIGIPLIGAGLAGGDWDAIKSTIDLATPDVDIVVVEWSRNVAEPTNSSN